MNSSHALAPPSRPLELLAPAGTLDVFETAINKGADAVYVGAPFLNARAMARPFNPSDIEAMVRFAHEKGRRVYVAMNSLLKDEEATELIELLWRLDEIGVDALIIQDMGIYKIVRRYFPDFRLHASTLSLAHNSLSVRQYQELGFERVVLARELSVDEIKKIRKKTKIELEVFVHGAMCFAYSGLCLFSSYLGGKSGLRGRCVQPCRRRYSWRDSGLKGGRDGYLFSMNDLEGIDQISALQRAGVRSIKIEGRMRSREYVAHVVQAYRMVLDGDPQDKHLIQEAHNILGLALGRKSSHGYFLSQNNSNLITPYHSGNIGKYLGGVQRVKNKRVQLKVLSFVSVGDRLRLHREKLGEREPFTLKNLWVAGKKENSAKSGTLVEFEVPIAVSAQDSIYLVSTKQARHDERNVFQVAQLVDKNIDRKSIPKNINQILAVEAFTQQPFSSAKKKKKKHLHESNKMSGNRKIGNRTFPISVWIKVDSFSALQKMGSFAPAVLLFGLGPETIKKQAQLMSIRRQFPQVTLSLPPIIEEAELPLYAKAIELLVKKGQLYWQVGNIGQLQLFNFPQAKRCHFFGDLTLNVVNRFAVQQLKSLNFQGCQIALESDKEMIKNICQGSSAMQLGLTIYGFPALFTAKADMPFFRYNKKFISPKQEPFQMQKRFGQTVTVSTTPFSLLPWLNELADFGIRYGVIDLSGQVMRRGMVSNIMKQANRRPRKGEHNSSFNYRGTLL